MTPLQVLQKDHENRAKAFRFRGEDGLIIVVLKFFLHYLAWHWLYRGFVRTALWTICKLNKEYPKRQATLWVRWMADVYMLLMGSLLIWSYLCMFAFAKSIASTAGWQQSSTSLTACALLALTLSIYRTVESYSVLVMLHANGDYESPAPMRSISKTMWAYLEVITAFATFFVLAAICAGDDFGSDKEKQFFGDLVNPLYFSMISMATVGYGDFTPTKPAGKWLVLIEIVLGLILLVVALQRVLAGSLPKPSDKQQPDQPT